MGGTNRLARMFEMVVDVLNPKVGDSSSIVAWRVWLLKLEDAWRWPCEKSAWRRERTRSLYLWTERERPRKRDRERERERERETEKERERETE